MNISKVVPAASRKNLEAINSFVDRQLEIVVRDYFQRKQDWIQERPKKLETIQTLGKTQPIAPS